MNYMISYIFLSKKIISVPLRQVVTTTRRAPVIAEKNQDNLQNHQANNTHSSPRRNNNRRCYALVCVRERALLLIRDQINKQIPVYLFWIMPQLGIWVHYPKEIPIHFFFSQNLCKCLG